MTNRLLFKCVIVCLLACFSISRLAASTLADAMPDELTQFLAVCHRGNQTELQQYFTPDAIVHGQPIARLLSALAVTRPEYRFNGFALREISPTHSVCLLTYSSGTVQGFANLELKCDQEGPWRIARLSHAALAATMPGDSALLFNNPIRHLYIGASNTQEINYWPQQATEPLAVRSWQARLRVGNTAYPINITGPELLQPFVPATITLDVPAAHANILKDNQTITSILEIQCVTPDAKLVMQQHVNLFNNAAHNAVHVSLIDSKRLEINPRRVDFQIEEIRVRFRIVELSNTYYACMRFKGGYAGFQYWPERNKHPFWFSVWNNPRKSWEQRNRFEGVNTDAGFQTVEVQKRNVGDENYANIHNTELHWKPDTDYTFILQVSPRKMPGNETWTQFTLTAVEHNITADGTPQDVQLPFGSILRNEQLKVTYCNAFMEALGKKYNYQRRQMEIRQIQYRTRGSQQLEEIDLHTVTHDDNMIRYPKAAWVTPSGFRLSSGGQTPLRPGELLLDY